LKRLPDLAPPTLGSGRAKTVVVCSRCRRRLKRCPDCGLRFYPNESLICLPGDGTRGHVHPGCDGTWSAPRAAG
jgi:hypothetical protein